MLRERQKKLRKVPEKFSKLMAFYGSILGGPESQGDHITLGRIRLVSMRRLVRRLWQKAWVLEALRSEQDNIRVNDRGPKLCIEGGTVWVNRPGGSTKEALRSRFKRLLCIAGQSMSLPHRSDGTAITAARSIDPRLGSGRHGWFDLWAPGRGSWVAREVWAGRSSRDRLHGRPAHQPITSL